MARLRLGITFRHVDEAHVTVEGTVEPIEGRQIAALLTTLVDIGARQLFIDLAGVETCDPDFLDYLGGLRHQVVSLDGWVVVEGAPTLLVDADTLALDELFTIYARVARPPSPMVDPLPAPVLPDPRAPIPGQPSRSQPSPTPL